MEGLAEGTQWQAIVLTWDGREDTLACLASLARVTDPPVRVVVADNGSTDGTVAAVREAFPHVGVVENDGNLGYAGGNNAGIRDALIHGAAWVVLVNNDATVAPDAFMALERAAAAHPRAGVLAGKVFFADPPDVLWYAGATVSPRLGYSGRVRGYGRRDGAEYARREPTDRATGAFMAISRPALEAAGLLDEAFFAYVEDTEWCLRIRRAAFEVLFVPDAVAWHAVSASTGGEQVSTHNLYYGARNTVAMCERHAPLGPAGTWLRRSVVLATHALQAAGRPARRPALRAAFDGWRDGCAGRMGIRPG